MLVVGIMCGPQATALVPGAQARAGRAGLGRLLGTLILALGFIQAGHSADQMDGRDPGTVRMAERLREIAAKVNPLGNPFLSRERVAALEALMARNPGQSNLAKVQFDLGAELLNAGRNADALARFRLVEALGRAEGRIDARDEVNVWLNQALCHLRDAEFQNCLSNHNADSCLLPLRGGGIHSWTDGSRRAIGVLTNLLAAHGDSLAARWLLNVAKMTVGEYPDGLPEAWRIPPAAFRSEYDLPRFVDVAGPAGLAFRELSGGSVAEDFDRDGWIDLMITSIGLGDQMHYLHNQGDGRFEDRTRAAGLTGLVGGLNLISADYNNDGFVDVLVLRGGWMKDEGAFPKSLLRNNGNGTFSDVTEAAGVLSFHPTQTGVWLDFDGDGWLDFFIGNESSPGGGRSHPCELFHNNRDGTFTEMAAAAGVAARSYVKGVTAGDFNNDGRPDLYLSVKGRRNLLYRNDGPAEGNPGGWKFTEVGASAGVQLPLESFPTWFFDYDNDGWEDLFVAGYHIRDVGDVAADYLGLPGQGEKSRLYRNLGNGRFEDVSRQVHLDRVLLAMGCNFGDLDNDGWLDFYLGTGDPDLLTIIPNRMFRNAEGRLFQDVTTSGGFGNLQKGHGISFADFDNDGDQDVHENMGGAVSSDTYPNLLYLNPGNRNHWIKLQLVGVRANRSAIGARLKITASGASPPSGHRTICRTVNTGASFGGNPLRQEIGLGQCTNIISVEIRWPGSGTVQSLSGLAVDAGYRVTEGRAEVERMTLRSFSFAPPDAPGAMNGHGGHQHHH